MSPPRCGRHVDHLADPTVAIGEAHRVLVPGGRRLRAGRTPLAVTKRGAVVYARK